MKKLTLTFVLALSFSVIPFLWTSLAGNGPPFEVPPKGGLPACMEDLNLCNSALDACEADLAECQVLPGDGYSNPDTFGISGHGPALNYTDNSDGTFTDDNSRLMWEIKDDSGGIHDKDNVYTWSNAADGDKTNPDGTLFTVFLYTLNNTCQNDETIDCSTNGDADCAGLGGSCGFAGYRDWRIPNIKELQSIVDHSTFSPATSVPPPSRPGPHWSATTSAYNNEFAWFLDFDYGNANLYLNKEDGFFARAVRP